jgi:hypothetical protein
MCTTIARAALDGIHGGCDVISANDITTLRDELARVRLPHVLLHSEAPDAGLVDTLRRSDAPYVIVTSDPLSVVQDLMAERQIDLPSAIRAASLNLSCLHDLALTPSAVVIRRMGYEDDLHGIVRALMRSTTSVLEASDTEKLLISLFPEGRNGGRWSITKILECYFSNQAREPKEVILSREEIELTKSALGDFSQLGSQKFNRAQWAPAIFLSIDTGGAYVPDIINITGTFRCPVYGPYIHLPPGTWRGTCNIRVWDNHGRVTYRLDVFSSRTLFETDLRLPVSGDVECSFLFDNPSATEAIQIRLIQIQGAIEGYMEFYGVSIERQDHNRVASGLARRLSDHDTKAR